MKSRSIAPILSSDDLIWEQNANKQVNSPKQDEPEKEPVAAKEKRPTKQEMKDEKAAKKAA